MSLMSILVSDRILHKRESEWLTFLERIEDTANGIDELDEEDAIEQTLLMYSSCSEEDDDHNGDDEYEGEDGDPSSDAEEMDYQEFQNLLQRANKEKEDRKRRWAKTGDSFVLDHLSETMRVADWVKENLSEQDADKMDISTCFGEMCKARKLQEDTLLASRTYMTPTSRHSLNKAGKCPQSDPINHTQHKRRTTGQIPSVRRLSVVPESPSRVATVEGSGALAHQQVTTTTTPKNNQRRLVRHTMSCSRLSKTNRSRTIIYSPCQRQMPAKFKDLFKMASFNPKSTLVYEAPSGAEESSASDDDVFLTFKRRYGGTIYEI